MIFRNPFPLCKYDAFIQHRWRFTEYNTAKRENQTKHRGLHSRSAAVRRYSTAACRGNVIFSKYIKITSLKRRQLGSRSFLRKHLRTAAMAIMMAATVARLPTFSEIEPVIVY